MMHHRTGWTGLAVLVLSFGPGPLWAQADDSAGTGSSPFHRAYWLEVEKGDYDAASAIYEELARSGGEHAPEARKRLASLRELLRGRNLASYAPANTLAYAELHRPGHQLIELLELMGLDDLELADLLGEEAKPGSDQPLLSPKLLEAFESIDSAAVAVTGVDPILGVPMGLAIVHTGRSRLVQGLIETALAAGTIQHLFEIAEPIAGARCFVGPFASVALTEHSLFVASNRKLLADALSRDPKSDGALSQHPGFVEARQTEAGAKASQTPLLTVWVNAREGVRLGRAFLEREGDLEEYRLAQLVGDIESLRWAKVSFGRAGQRLAFDFALALDEDNHALPYHLFRTPAVRPEALHDVPRNALGFLAFSLGAEGASFAPQLGHWTGLDLGREIFGNLRDVAVFVAPGPGPIDEVPPAVGISLSVHDAARSEKLWSELLRLPAILLDGEADAVRRVKVAGVEATSYDFPEGIRIHCARTEDRLVATTDLGLLEKSLSRDGRLLSDPGAIPAFIKGGPRPSKVAWLHLGRILGELTSAGQLPDEIGDALVPALSKGSFEFSTDETPARFHLRAQVTVPRLTKLLREVLRENLRYLDVGVRRGHGRSAHARRHYVSGDAEAAIDTAASVRADR